MVHFLTQHGGGLRASILGRGAPAAPKETPEPGQAGADSAHVGDIVGAFGRIRRDGTDPFRGRCRRLRTLMVITGPGTDWDGG